VVSYNCTICPYCGGELIFPITGEITKCKKTWEAWLQQEKYCMKYEVVDEVGNTLKYGVRCRNENKS